MMKRFIRWAINKHRARRIRSQYEWPGKPGKWSRMSDQEVIDRQARLQREADEACAAWLEEFRRTDPAGYAQHQMLKAVLRGVLS